MRTGEDRIIIGICANFEFVAESVTIFFAASHTGFFSVIIRAVYFDKVHAVAERRFFDRFAAKVEIGFYSEFFNGFFASTVTSSCLCPPVAALDLHETAAKQHAIIAVNKVKIVMIFSYFPLLLF